MKKIKYIIFCLTLSLCIQVATPVTSSAQCPMCRMSAESNLKAGGTQAKGLNKGILFMLSMPYLLVGTMVIVWRRTRTKEDEDHAAGISTGVSSATNS